MNYTHKGMAGVVGTVFVTGLALISLDQFSPTLFTTTHANFISATVLSVVCYLALRITAARPSPANTDDDSETFNQLLEGLPDGILGVDQNGHIRFLNRQIQMLFQYSPAELLDKPVEVLIPDRFAQSHIQHRSRFMQAPTQRAMGARMDLTGRRSDGSEFPVSISLNSLTTQGEIYTTCSIRDISERKHEREALQDANNKLSIGMRDLEKNAQELRSLNELGELLQGCVSEQEANIVIERVMARLSPTVSGGIYTMRASRDYLQLTASWGENAKLLSTILAPNDCWGMRRGRLHAAENSGDTIGCEHVNTAHSGCLCIPMLAQGEVLGILHAIAPVDAALRRDQERSILDSKRMLFLAAAEQIGLALSNLRLREELRNQSIRDSLTGLYNRRFMEESLAREIPRVSHADSSLSLIALDLDHFKRFNDSFGHEGGDAVLSEVGSLLRDACTGSDLACRVGGEEFILMLPDKSLDLAYKLAETIRRRFENLHVVLGDRSLGEITASFGVAEYPRDGKDASEVLRVADVALYEAKACGRNRVIRAESLHQRRAGNA